MPHLMWLSRVRVFVSDLPHFFAHEIGPALAALLTLPFATSVNTLQQFTDRDSEAFRYP